MIEVVKKEAVDFKRGQKFATLDHDLDTLQSILANRNKTSKKQSFSLKLVPIVVKAKKSG